MAGGVAALDLTVVAGGGQGGADLQGGIQHGLDHGVVAAHLCHQAHQLVVGGDGAHAHLNAGVGAPIDGDGVVPVHGAPGDDVGVHQGVVGVGGGEGQKTAQTVVFTGNGVGGTGIGLDLGKLLPQSGVFRLQGLVAEHIAVELLRGIPQLAHAAAQRGQKALGDIFKKGKARKAADDGQGNGKHHCDDQHHLDLG